MSAENKLSLAGGDSASAGGVENNADAMGSSELCGLTIALGLLGGVLFACFDVARHAPHTSAFDALIATGFAGCIGVCLLLAIGIGLALVSTILSWKRSRLHCSAILIAAFVFTLFASFVLVGTAEYRNLKGLVMLFVPAPLLAAAAGILVLRMKWTSKPAVMLVVTFAAAQAVLLALCGGLEILAWSHSRLITAGWVAMTMIGFLVVAFLATRSPVKVGVCLGVLLPVTVGALTWQDHTAASMPDVYAAESLGKPNVVLIVLDTTRRDYLGCYGDDGDLTPALDKIASEGVVYEDAISAAPWTVPSHASIFTGLHPVTHGCSYEHRIWLYDDFTTIAEELGSNGYQTIALSTNIYLDRCNLLQGFEHAERLTGPYDDLYIYELARYLGVPRHWTDKGSSESCIEVAKWFKRQHDPDQPLFLFVNLLEPHRPYLPPMAERAAALDGHSGYFASSNLATSFDHFLAQAQHRHDPATADIMRRLYRASLKYQDSRLGELIGMLDRALDPEQTLLIITSDHGENIGEAGRWEHLFDINDTLIHVPLVVRYPKRFPPGRRIKGLCQTVDLAPTIYDVAGLSQPDLPGRSLAPDQFVPREAAFSQSSPFYPMLGPLDVQLGFARGSIELRAHRRAIRTDQYKFVWNSNGDHELYDITQDPIEETNLYAVLPDEAARLERQLDEWRASQPIFERRASAEEMADQDELIKRLRSLGYIN